MKITCPHCKRTLNVSEKYAGKTAKCPGCEKPFRVEFQESVAIVASVGASPLPEAEPAEPEDFLFAFDSPVSSVSSSRRFLNKKKKPTNLWGFIDLGFQHYLTPIIVKVIWALCLGQAVLGLAVSGLYAISTMLPESSHRQQSLSSDSQYDSRPNYPPSSPPSAVETKTAELVYKIATWIGTAIVTAIVLLVVRVICESIIVLFNIAESLASIDKKTATG
jgi:hypothetical protein